MVISENNNSETYVDVDCEYSLLVDLAAAKSIEALDLALEKLLNVVFGTSLVEVLSPNEVPDDLKPEADEKRLHISTELDENIRAVIVRQPRTSPMRRFLDAALDIYTHHYELLLKSQVDKLTGLFNRQVLEERVKSLNGSAGHAERRHNEPLRIVVMFDIDHFKSINDNFGHLYGDEVLVIISHMMRKTFRVDDWLFRYGGEEFLVILNNVELLEAKSVITRFLQEVASHDFPQIGKVTISAGFTQYDAGRAFAFTLDEADKALYYSKNNGRNQSHHYAELTSSGEIEAIDRNSDIDLF